LVKKYMDMFKQLKKLLRIPGGRYIIVEHGEPQYVLMNFKEYLKLADKTRDGWHEYDECEDQDDEDYDDEDLEHEDEGDEEDEDFVAEDWLAELNQDLAEAEEKSADKKPEAELVAEDVPEKMPEEKDEKIKEPETVGDIKIEDLPF